ncbi:C40 family peptidase [Psychroflexus sp. YR1-1]|uniref:C40 family peptidase n=1 Tax=Psychroflexus aurantiacus TaxID=2709310 RepID=A0A6B3R1F6_9FLAO|nr:C40 family peptidase [Psychroflexus aurantiacus]NEV94423.1 C40 family peptidase [Psychroflexus aurantiacus]
MLNLQNNIGVKLLLCAFAWTLASCGGSKRAIQAETERVNTISSIVSYSKTYLGTPYKYGGMNPSGIDCSGLLHLSFLRYGIELPRTVKQLSKTGKSLNFKHVDVGDLVFFRTSKTSRKVNHVGLVVYRTKKTVDFIHSSSSQGVMISSINNPYWRKNYVKSRRVIY